MHSCLTQYNWERPFHFIYGKSAPRAECIKPLLSWINLIHFYTLVGFRCPLVVVMTNILPAWMWSSSLTLRPTSTLKKCQPLPKPSMCRGRPDSTATAPSSNTSSSTATCHRKARSPRTTTIGSRSWLTYPARTATPSSPTCGRPPPTYSASRRSTRWARGRSHTTQTEWNCRRNHPQGHRLALWAVQGNKSWNLQGISLFLISLPVAGQLTRFRLKFYFTTLVRAAKHSRSLLCFYIFYVVHASSARMHYEREKV